ncbi:MAG: thioredoxin family protein [Ignavibacteriales bacterium CG_4_9_14_3_um_filter_34_10]|nr:MAG: thioredoxin family protein [Ignavibacteriales bacterium CG_4_9_14_3_um_filter_34_10]
MKTENLLSKINFADISYETYLKNFKNKIDSENIDNLSPKDLELLNYTKLNYQRTQRIHKTFKPNDKLISVMNIIDKQMIWMVITEPWCGDSAQNLPFIYEISKLNENIQLKIIYRDKNLDIMDLYLTDGKSRSIPKLVVFSEFGDELFQWGPRPVELVNQIDKWKSEGLTKEEFLPMIHLWYAQDKGNNLINEILNLLS